MNFRANHLTITVNTFRNVALGVLLFVSQGLNFLSMRSNPTLRALQDVAILLLKTR